MFTLDASAPAEVGPISWLVGVWEGTGVIDYPIGDERVSAEFGQRITFAHHGQPYLEYRSEAWELAHDDDEGHDSDRPPGRRPAPQSEPEFAPAAAPGVRELGYWRLRRALGDGDPGPGMLPRTGDRVFTTADEVDSLRSPEGAFELEVSIAHPDGVSELYLGQVQAGRIDLGTDAVLRSSTAKEYAAATRLYGLVDEHLLWAWDIAAFGQELRSHASARLARVEQ